MKDKQVFSELDIPGTKISSCLSAAWSSLEQICPDHIDFIELVNLIDLMSHHIVSHSLLLSVEEFQL